MFERRRREREIERVWRETLQGENRALRRSLAYWQDRALRSPLPPPPPPPPPPDSGLGEPVCAFAETFSAERVVLDHFFPLGPHPTFAPSRVRLLDWSKPHAFPLYRNPDLVYVVVYGEPHSPSHSVMKVPRAR